MTLLPLTWASGASVSDIQPELSVNVNLCGGVKSPLGLIDS